MDTQWEATVRPWGPAEVADAAAHLSEHPGAASSRPVPQLSVAPRAATRRRSSAARRNVVDSPSMARPSRTPIHTRCDFAFLVRRETLCGGDCVVFCARFKRGILSGVFLYVYLEGRVFHKRAGAIRPHLRCEASREAGRGARGAGGGAPAAAARAPRRAARARSICGAQRHTWSGAL